MCFVSFKVDPNGLRTLCQQYGPLLTFQLNLRYGNSLIRYGSKEQARDARAALNGRSVAGTALTADFASDGDIGSFFEQTMDWTPGATPGNTPGNQWSFSGTGPSDVTAAKPSPHPRGEVPIVNPAGQWGQAPAVPSQLWGSAKPLVGGNFVQAPSMWSFPSGAQSEGDSQSGAGENGLVSPSMATFLPPGLLNSSEPI